MVRGVLGSSQGGGKGSVRGLLGNIFGVIKEIVSCSIIGLLTG